MQGRILYVTMHSVFATQGGGCLASRAFFSAFCDIFPNKVDLVCVRESIKKDVVYEGCKIYGAPPRKFLCKVMSVFTGDMHRFSSFVKNILQTENAYEMIVFDHNAIGGSLVRFAKKKGLKTITIHHNCEKIYFRDNASFFHKILFLGHVIKKEKIAYLNSDLNLFLTSYDLELLKSMYGAKSNSFVVGVFDFCEKKIEVTSNKKDDSNYIFAITGTMQNYQTYCFLYLVFI